jgi:hypothetical protein
MRERDFVAQAVILLGLHDLPFLGRVGPKAARIIVAHRDIRRAMHHPARQFAGQPRPPADADLRAAAAPVVAHARRRADQRVAIGRMAEIAPCTSRLMPRSAKIGMRFSDSSSHGMTRS